MKFDILEDSVQDICDVMFTEAYGGREVVDYYETPAALTLGRVASRNSDCHIELQKSSEESSDVVKLSEMDRFYEVFNTGMKEGGSTRNPFIWRSDSVHVNGVFGAAFKHFGEIIAIMVANGMYEQKNAFEVYFKQEWGINNDVDLSHAMPSLRAHSDISFAAITENRNPDVFIHPNTTNDAKFTWHSVNREKLSKRAGREVSYDFAKARAYADFQLRMLRNETALKSDRFVRLDFSIIVDEIPPPLQLRHFPIPAIIRKPSGLIMDLIQKSVMAIGMMAKESNESIMTKLLSSEILQMPNDFGPQDLSMNRIVSAPTGGLSFLKVASLTQNVTDDEYFVERHAINKDQVKTFKAARKKDITLGREELHWLIDPILPKSLFVDINTFTEIGQNIHARRSVVKKLLGINFMGNFRLILQITSTSKEIGDSKARKYLNELGLKPEHHHKHKGDKILSAAFQDDEVVNQFFSLLQKVAYSRFGQMANRQYTTHYFFHLWKQVGSFEGAFEIFVTQIRKKWANAYSDRAKFSSKSDKRIHYQLRSKLYRKIRVFWRVLEPAIVELPKEDFIDVLVNAHMNYLRKREKPFTVVKKKSESKHRKKKQFEVNLIDVVMEKNQPYMGMSEEGNRKQLQDLYRSLDTTQECAAKFDELLSPKVRMVEILDSVLTSLTYFQNDIDDIFHKAKEEFTEHTVAPDQTPKEILDLLEDSMNYDELSSDEDSDEFISPLPYENYNPLSEENTNDYGDDEEKCEGIHQEDTGMEFNFDTMTFFDTTDLPSMSNRPLMEYVAELKSEGIPVTMQQINQVLELHGDYVNPSNQKAIDEVLFSI